MYPALTWNGTLVTEPILIFQDELIFDGTSDPEFSEVDAPGALVCRSETRQPRWNDVIGNNRIPTSGNIQVIETEPATDPGFSQLIRGDEAGSDSDDHNGLITCRVGASGFSNVDVVASLKYVALYIREEGELWNQHNNMNAPISPVTSHCFNS